MFDKKKYITKGAMTKLPPELQSKLWLMIEEARGKTKLDYLQVFELTPHQDTSHKSHSSQNWIQKIKHFQ